MAEVLITLAIIGVVAALTMPVLVASYQKQQTVVRLEKAYSEIAQALKMAEVEYEDMSTWEFGSITNVIERNTFFGENYLLKHIKTLEKCLPVSNKCWKQPVNLNGNLMNNGNYLSVTADSSAFVAASGYAVYYWIDNVSGWLYIDIDGPGKGPAMVGKDVFAFNVKFAVDTNYNRIGLSPAGAITKSLLTRAELINDSLYGCSKSINAPAGGLYCAALIAVDGWEIKDDYPW